jgi:hypothetical protein
MHSNIANRVRSTTLVALIAAAVAYWSGARWGARGLVQTVAVAGQKSVPSGLHLTEEEARTIGIYRQAAPAVANIITQAVEYDFFERAVPVEGAGGPQLNLLCKRSGRRRRQSNSRDLLGVTVSRTAGQAIPALG